jgi:3-oxoacyl-[acyl-carrier protein] reductase
MMEVNPMDPFRLEEKVALVTGGASGIGKAVSLALAGAGAQVAVHYLSSEAGAEEVGRAVRGMGRQPLLVKADLTKPGAADRIVGETVIALGGLDILVNNAGNLVERCPVAEMSDELYRTILDVNLTTTFAMCRAALRHMLPQGSGSIVNISSAAAFAGGGSGAAVYAASKAAIVGFTRALSKEVGGKGIRVNAVAPGQIATQFHERFSTPEGRAATVRTIPLGREGTAEEIGPAVVFLASPAASFVSGEVLGVNGAMWFH